MQLTLVLVLGLAYAVNARDCLNPDPMDNMDHQKFAGDWYEFYQYSPNATDVEEEKGVKCNHINYKVHDNDLEVIASYDYQGKHDIETGIYKTKENPKAMYTLHFPEHPQFSDYIFKILCTDYDHWAVYYSSAQYDAGHCSEFTGVMGRDKAKMGEMKNNEQVKECLNKMHVTMDTMNAIDHHECH